ncbi:MAG: hypothetical protein M1829_006796 [Trizodia sp. TS-e1964]|nr:MAG: hypothetical protein M1829_006796 [Trizodia sp. TS-e1964]
MFDKPNTPGTPGKPEKPKTISFWNWRDADTSNAPPYPDRVRPPPRPAQTPPPRPVISWPIMNSPRRPAGARSPTPGTISPLPGQANARNRTASFSSESSETSQAPLTAHAQQPAMLGIPGSNSGSPQNFSRPSISHAQTSDLPLRNLPAFAPSSPLEQRAARMHSQGFFEPSLPSAGPSVGGLTASQIAAQAAMNHQQQLQAQHHMQNSQQTRQRSQTIPSGHSPPDASVSTRRLPNSPPPMQLGQGTSTSGPGFTGLQYHNGLLGGSNTAAATAANAAYPRSALSSPGLAVPDMHFPEAKSKPEKEKSKMKLFSKPKSIGISKDKDLERKFPPLPSPNKMGVYGPSPMGRVTNASSTSLAETITAPSFYTNSNSSAAALMPQNERITTTIERPSKHHFLSRGKFKKEKDEAVTLASLKVLEPPPSFSSYTPSSPSPSVLSFQKSLSGLNIRNTVRSQQEKKKEEKAAASNTSGFDSVGDLSLSGEWHGKSSLSLASGQSGLGLGASINSHAGTDVSTYSALTAFGLPGMTADDAWPLFKAKLLVIFEGAKASLPCEDLNQLLRIHIQRCIHKRSPQTLVDDLQEFLELGFRSLEQCLRGIPDDRLLPFFVDLWNFYLNVIQVEIESAFLPLDIEFQGCGNMSRADAKEFWSHATPLPLGSPWVDERDVKRTTLAVFRDICILPRQDVLRHLFVRLSSESINAFTDPGPPTASPASAAFSRPGASPSHEPSIASYNSLGTTLVNDSVNSLGLRSRAPSSTTPAPPFPRPHFSGEPYVAADHSSSQNSTKIVELSSRLLQCILTVDAVQSGDEAQEQMDVLANLLKANWLASRKTGGNRNGFIGSRAPRS